MNRISAYLNNLSIRFKIVGAFALMLMVLVVVTEIPLTNISGINNKLITINDEVQPAVLSSLYFAEELNKASTQLGYYMLSQEDTFKEKYLQSIQVTEQTLHKLISLADAHPDDDVNKLITDITANLETLKGYNERLIYLSLNPAENMPALTYAGTNVNPVSQKILSSLTGMIQSELEEDVSEERRQLFAAISEFRYQWSNLMTRVRSYLAYRDPSAAKEAMVFYEITGPLLNKIMGYSDIFTFEEEDGMATLVEAREKFGVRLKEMIKIHNGEEWRSDSHFIKASVAPLVKVMETKVNQLIDIQKQKTINLGNSIQDQTTVLNGLLISLMVGGLIVGLIIAVSLSLSIIRPINNISYAMNDIAAGDGDLTKRLASTGNSELGKLSTAFNAFASKIQNTVTQVVQTSEQLQQDTANVSRITYESSEALQKEKKDIDHVTFAVEEMATTTQDIHQNTSLTAQSVDEARISAEKGHEIISISVSAMENLANEISKVLEGITKVNVESNNIGSVVDVINDISEQTNLLALNAAIEAARAGEQGRGFAVVADEVRTLSLRTNESTNEIKRIIERLQLDTREAVSSAEIANQHTVDTVTRVEDAALTLATISDALQKINDMASKIAHATEQQSTTADKLNERIVDINQAAEGSMRGAEQTAVASDHLAELAEELQQTVSQFRI